MWNLNWCPSVDPEISTLKDLLINMQYHSNANQQTSMIITKHMTDISMCVSTICNFSDLLDHKTS